MSTKTNVSKSSVSLSDLRKATTASAKEFKAIEKNYQRDVLESSIVLGKAINAELKADKRNTGIVISAIAKRTGLGNSTLTQCKRIAIPENLKAIRTAKCKSLEAARLALMSEEKRAEFVARETAKKEAIKTAVKTAKEAPVPVDPAETAKAASKAEAMGIDDDSIIDPMDEVIDDPESDPLEVGAMIFMGIMKTADNYRKEDRTRLLVTLIDALKGEINSEELQEAMGM